MQITRRTAIASTTAGLLTAQGYLTSAKQEHRFLKPIPGSNEKIPAIGMGTWLTFSVGQDKKLLGAREHVLGEFFKAGGGMIDSSPMYINSEETVGILLERLKRPKTFSATKVWTPIKDHGLKQLEDSRKLWKIPDGAPLDLVHVHNLLAIEHHLPMLREQKAMGKIRYVGLTTSHGRRHTRLERLLKTEPVDFVQFSYNILDRSAENRLLPAAQDNGVAVVINRPFRTGQLFDILEHKKLPEWATDIGCRNWAQFMLKFIISHPAVTCAIPATTRTDHMRENMTAGIGPMPDANMRERMVRYVEELL